MKNRFLVIAVLLIVVINANSQGIVYASFNDLCADNGFVADVEMSKKKKRTLQPPYRIKVKEHRSIAKNAKKALIIKLNDELFLNCKKLNLYDNGRHMRELNKHRYVKCHKLGNDKLIFTLVDYGSNAARMIPSALEDVIYGSMTALLSKEDLIEDVTDYVLYKKSLKRIASKNKACYILKANDESRVERVDYSQMLLLLDSRLDLIGEYEQLNPQIRECPEVVYSFLIRADKIK